MKTALQELIERLDAKHEVIPVEVYRKGLEYAKAVATKLLEKEREQIEKACAYGFRDALKPSGSQVLNTFMIPNWKQYYNETFNQNK